MLTVLDAPCGAGKSTWAIKYINDNPDVSFIVITPFLKEVERFKQKCPNANFKEPKKERTKLNNFHKLLTQGANIVSTHSLFSSSTEETRELINANNYVLILDEVMSVITDIKLKPDDLALILECNYAHIDENKRLIWDKDDYIGSKFADIKEYSSKGSVIVVNNIALLWEFPADIFKCFRETYVLTYMFMCQIQRYYYDLHKIPYELKGIQNGDLCDYHEVELDGSLIHLYDGKMNSIGLKETALSHSWYTKSSKGLKNVLKKNSYNYLRNIQGATSRESMWTTFKTARQQVKPPNYSNAFVPCNARSTNEYINRRYLVYLVNIYMNPMVAMYFQEHGIKVDHDAYAISELIQWLYRSCIRIQKDVYLYIPSKRMRTLLKQKLPS